MAEFVSLKNEEEMTFQNGLQQLAEICASVNNNNEVILAGPSPPQKIKVEPLDQDEMSKETPDQNGEEPPQYTTLQPRKIEPNSNEKPWETRADNHQPVTGDNAATEDEDFRYFFPNYCAPVQQNNHHHCQTAVAPTGNGMEYSLAPDPVPPPSVYAVPDANNGGGGYYTNEHGVPPPPNYFHNSYWQQVVPNSGWQNQYYHQTYHFEHHQQYVTDTSGYDSVSQNGLYNNDGSISLASGGECSYSHGYGYAYGGNEPPRAPPPSPIDENSQMGNEVDGGGNVAEDESNAGDELSPQQPDSLENHQENFRNHNHNEYNDNTLSLNEIQRLKMEYGHQRFPVKLWNLATDEMFDPIQWSENGQSLVIDERKLEPNLEFLFRSKKYTSFLRQLHLYGFRKVTRARNYRPMAAKLDNLDDEDDHHHQPQLAISEYYSLYFQRGNYELVKKVRRYYANSNKKKKSPDSDSNSVPAAGEAVAAAVSIENQGADKPTNMAPAPAPAASYYQEYGRPSELLMVGTPIEFGTGVHNNGYPEYPVYNGGDNGQQPTAVPEAEPVAVAVVAKNQPESNNNNNNFYLGYNM